MSVLNLVRWGGLLSMVGGITQVAVLTIKNDVIVEVTDNGIGIPKENLLKVFEPFFTTKKNSSNYGLGLSYCGRVMKQHGGSLVIVKSEMNKGTTVRLCFPKKRIMNWIRLL